ncbi:hypothetical protein [Adhaeribacter terreus]|uniref:DUF4124 domain-containing protein n=1 Tax=Adhaeribacter terreus TaxID=529703 RepID=A0ABW0EC88_9BACT
MKVKIIAVTGIILCLIIISILAYFNTKDFWAIDACLDKGGRWNYETKKCEYGPKLPD